MDPINQPHVRKVLRRVRKELPEKNIWIYAGYTWEDILSSRGYGHTHLTLSILELTDVPVDGPFIIEEKDISLSFRNSRNQRIIAVQESLNRKITIMNF